MRQKAQNMDVICVRGMFVRDTKEDGGKSQIKGE
jgi:hypothetical protein